MSGQKTIMRRWVWLPLLILAMLLPQAAAADYQFDFDLIPAYPIVPNVQNLTPDELPDLEPIEPEPGMMVENPDLELNLVWHRAVTLPFQRVKAMTEFNGTLYALVGSQNSAKLYKLDHLGCRIWLDVTPPWKSGTGDGSKALAVFSNNLYVGTDEGEIFKSPSGSSWQNVTGNYPSGVISDFAVFNGQLYVGSSGISIYRGTGNGSWTPVVGPTPAKHGYGFGDSTNHDLQSLKTFNGQLYAGVGRDNNNGIEIWRTPDGANWAMFKDVPKPTGPIAGSNPGHVHAMEVFNNHLYIGEYHGSGLFRTDGSSNSWDYVYDPNMTGGGVLSLHTHGGRLYLGMYNLFMYPTPGTPILFYTDDGSNWKYVKDAPTETQDINGIGAMASFGGRLFVGSVSSRTSNPFVEIHDYGLPPAPICQMAAVDDGIFNDLIPPMIDPSLLTPREKSYNPMDEGWEFPPVASVRARVEALKDHPEVAPIYKRINDDLDAIDEQIGLALEIMNDSAENGSKTYKGDGMPDEAKAHFQKALEICLGITLYLPRE